MSQLIQCPHCSQSYTITPEQAPQYAGQTIQCTRCGQAFTVNLPSPAPAAAPTQPPPQPQWQPQFQPPPEYRTAQPGQFQGQQGFTPPPMGAGIQYQSPMASPKASGLAITSLVLGCLGLLFAPLGLIAI